jgi:hypothetical protein
MTYPASTVPRSRRMIRRNASRASLTVMYMLAGRIRHRDSAGHEGVVSAGGVQVQYGPFVMNNRAEIRRAIDDAAAGRLGAIPARNLRAREAIQ